MGPEKEPKIQQQRKTSIKIIKWILFLIIVLIVFSVLFAPFLISTKKGQKIILAKINSVTDGQVSFSDLSIGWLKGIKVIDFFFNNSAKSLTVQAKQITTKPHYGTILIGNLSFGQTIIDEPKVKINLKTRHLQKTQIPPEKSLPVQRQKPMILPIKRIDLTVNDGNVQVTDTKARTVELSQIKSKVNLRPLGQQSNFDLNTIVVDEGKTSMIHATGQINTKAKKGWTLKGTTGDLTAEVNDLYLESLGPIFELAGLDIQAKGNVSANINSKIKDGSLESLSANIGAKNLDITGSKLKGDRIKTDTLDFDIKLTQNKQVINIDRLQLRSDWASVTASGNVPATFVTFTDFFQTDLSYNLKGNIDCDLAILLSQMSRTFGLKEGMRITEGKLTGEIDTHTEADKIKVSGRANLTGLEGTIDEKDIALSAPITADIRITSDTERTNFDKLDITAPFAKISATGSLEQIKYELWGDLSKFQSELGQFANLGQYEVAGELVSNGQVSIKERKISANGVSSIKNLRLTSVDDISASEPKAELAFSLDIDQKSKILTANSIEVNSSLGKVNIKNAILPLSKESSKPMDLAISASAIDLEKIQPYAVLFASVPPKVRFAGIAESLIKISSRNGVYQIQTDTTKIKNFKLISEEKEPFIQEQVTLFLDAQIDLAQKSINVKELRLETPQIKIKKGEFQKTSQGEKTKLQGQIECEYDWKALSDIASAFLPEGLKLEGKRSSFITFYSEYPTEKTNELLANLNTKTKLGFEKAQYLGLYFGLTELDIQVQNGLLKIAPFSTTVNNGRFQFAGTADFKEKPTVLKTPRPIQIAKDIQINKETTEKLFMYINPIFANVINVSGVANFDCESLAIPLASTIKKDIIVIGTISIIKLQMEASDLLSQILSAIGTSPKGQEITIHPTKFALQDGFLKYDNMQVDVGENPINFGGVIGLDKSLDMTVTLPYTTQGKLVKVGQGYEGQRVSLPLKGTITKPQLDVNKMLQDQLKLQIEDQLRKGLEGLFR